MVHDGLIRRSEDAFSEVIWRGISPAVCRLILLGSSQNWSDAAADRGVLQRKSRPGWCCAQAVLWSRVIGSQKIEFPAQTDEESERPW